MISALPINFQGAFLGWRFYIINQFDIYNKVVVQIWEKETNSLIAEITGEKVNNEIENNPIYSDEEIIEIKIRPYNKLFNTSCF